MSELEQSFGIFHVHEDEEVYVQLHASSASIDEMRELAAPEYVQGLKDIDDEETIEDDESENTAIDETRTDEYGSQIWSAFDDIYAYYDLLIYFTDMMPTIGRNLYKLNVVDFAKKNFEVEEVANGVNIYRLDSTDTFRISRHIKRVRRFDSSGAKIRSSILLSLVATFDAVFSDLCQYLMTGIKERYEGSDRKYSVQEILALDSVDELIEQVIYDEVSHIMNGSHTDQMKFFENTFHIDFIKNYPRWADYIEIFERRNLAAHGDLIVNKIYLEKCKAAGKSDCAEIGEKLEITQRYMRQCVDLMIEVIVLISFQVWRKRCPDESLRAYSLVVNMSFELLKNGNPVPALRIAQFAYQIKDKNCDIVTRNMLAVNMAIGEKMTGNDDKCREILEAVDWSGSSALFKLCVNSLKIEIDEAVKYLGPAAAADEIDIVAIREWPVFKWIRSETRFRDAVEEVFSESLVKNEPILIEDQSDPSDALEDDVEDTSHDNP